MDPFILVVDAMMRRQSSEIERLRKAGVFLQIGIAGFDGQVSKVSARQFRPGENIDPWEVSGTSPVAAGFKADLLMGEHQAFSAHEAEHPKWYYSPRAATEIKILLERQRKMDENVVGLPFSILSIRKNGASWIMRGRGCQSTLLVKAGHQ